MTSILIKKTGKGSLRVFSLVRGGSEVKCLRTTAVAHPNPVYIHLTRDSIFLNQTVLSVEVRMLFVMCVWGWCLRNLPIQARQIDLGRVSHPCQFIRPSYQPFWSIMNSVMLSKE
jgi:hypothetical protein